MQSAIYQGWVRHRRFRPRPHDFRYGLGLLYLDIDELEWLVRDHRLLGASASLPLRFHRSDYLDGQLKANARPSLREAVDQRLVTAGLAPSEGPIRLLTQIRLFGFVFNPVSFYYVYDRHARQVEAIIAEITNTPWKERHCYVLSRDESVHPVEGQFRFRFPKAFHVSPFMPMNCAYDWRFSTPDEQIAVHMRIEHEQQRQFDATMQLQRQPLTQPNLRRMALRRPLQTLKVVAAIHWQALKLWLKRVPVFDHPSKQPPSN
jgi:hypothetical protein